MTREKLIYKKSLELAFHFLKIAAENMNGDEGPCGPWEESAFEICSDASFHIAKGSALYPASECLEFWKTAQLTLQELYLMLDIAYEEQKIHVGERKELARQIMELSRLLSTLISDVQGQWNEA